MEREQYWDTYESWEEAEEAWNRQALAASQKMPLKGLKTLPRMPGITPEAARHLKWKALKWMATKDHQGEVRRGLMKHPLKYGSALIKSAFQSKPYKRDGDFFLYGLDSVEQFYPLVEDVENTLFAVGFSYCHKPFECPAGRFTPECQSDSSNPICQQCFIGKAINALPKANVVPLLIPTIHYIGGKIFELVHGNPGKKVIFLITACEMTLEMFGDWGNMVGIQGIGVRLDGRICNTMEAFALSENGIKPGLTVVLDETQRRMLDLIRHRREAEVSVNSKINFDKANTSC